MKKNKLLITVIVICLVSIIGMVTAVLYMNNKNKEETFVPPAFEQKAKKGSPKVDDNLGYSKIYKDGMNFTAWVCGNVISKKDEAYVYFTNDKDNKVWLKLRILDDKGNILGESGILKPDEYVETINLSKNKQDNTNIKLKIMAYEPNTYYSAGSVVMSTVLKIGE